MSVHGYPADMSIFVQLGLLKLQEDTSHADIDQDDVSLAGVLPARCSWSRFLNPSASLGRRFCSS